MNTKERGKWGEDLALEFVKEKGYKYVARNFRSRFGEIDLIIKNSEFIVFVEVKLRKNADFAEAREFVSYSKQNKIRSTANLWLSSRKLELQPRFDVIEIYVSNAESKPEINHIENAF